MLEPSPPPPHQGDPTPEPVGRELSAALPGVADGVFRQLDSRYVDASRVSWCIFIAILAPLCLAAWVLAWTRAWVSGWMLLPLLMAGLALIALLVWLSAREPRWVWRNTSYAVRDLGIEIRKGILWKKVINVPHSRIQHTDVMQGPLGRHFGIAKLTIYTAGTLNSWVELDGLAHEVALEIRDYLIRMSETGGN